MIDLKAIAAGTTIAGALGFTALGMGPGLANAAPPSPVTSGTPWQQDEGHGHDGHGDHGDWQGGGDGGNWGPGPWYGPQAPAPWPVGCISGPLGWGSVSFCV